MLMYIIKSVIYLNTYFVVLIFNSIPVIAVSSSGNKEVCVFVSCICNTLGDTIVELNVYNIFVHGYLDKMCVNPFHSG